MFLPFKVSTDLMSLIKSFIPLDNDCYSPTAQLINNTITDYKQSRMRISFNEYALRLIRVTREITHLRRILSLSYHEEMEYLSLNEYEELVEYIYNID
jgi:hypothetical protein